MGRKLKTKLDERGNRWRARTDEVVSVWMAAETRGVRALRKCAPSKYPRLRLAFHYINFTLIVVPVGRLKMFRAGTQSVWKVCGRD